jgi:alpha-L-arabinofuranosidase
MNDSSDRKCDARPPGSVTRRTVTAGLAGAALGGAALVCRGASSGAQVNAPRIWPVSSAGAMLTCEIDPSRVLGPVDRRIFGSNLEWFNEGGGFASRDDGLRRKLTELARDQKLSVLRFPGGTLADYYDWRDGIGARHSRPVRRHPTDPGHSENSFGSPEFFTLLKETGAEGLITVNAGTSTPQAAADWVRYANAPGNAARRADGWAAPIGVNLWEVGNELYLPGSPGEVKITQTPEAYAANFVQFADAMRAADPTITLIAIGVAKSGIGPDTEFPDWTEKLLQGAASKIDMISVHNAYFPLLYHVKQPSVDTVYPAMWAAPEAVDRSLTKLGRLIERYENGRSIDVAITEWGALFSIPQGDPYWFDHVKTLGSGVYVARMLQVFAGQPRVKLANYFKFSDRSFMGWVGFNGEPKAPYWVFRLFAESTGGERVAASLDSPTYDTPAIGAVGAERGVAEVTVLATRDRDALFINFVNRSLTTSHSIRLHIAGGFGKLNGELRSVTAGEPTAHNGVDIPPEWPMKPDYEPYSSTKPGSMRIASRPWSKDDPVVLPPFSVMTLVLRSNGPIH